MRWLRRVRYWLRFREQQNDLRDELAFHHESLVAGLQERGLSARDANAAARRAMGNETYMREEARSVWLSASLDAFMKDWRYAWRGLRRSPAFALVAVASLGLGIGANTAIFSMVYSLLLARVPVHAPEELIELRRDLGLKGVDERLSRDEFGALSAGRMPLTMVASTGASVEIDDVTVNALLDAVDGSYFPFLGVGAERGRLISRSDDVDGAPVAVVTDRFWRGRMNADSLAIGRTLQINGTAFTVVGVTQPGFAGLRFPAIADVMIPYRAATAFGVVRERNARQPLVVVVGRRRAGEPMEGARAELTAAWSRCCVHGDRNEAGPGQTSLPGTIDVVDVSRGIPEIKLDLRGEYRRILLALMAGVGILLLAACANVANLLLARGSARTGEFAVRLALGASRRRLVTGLIVESVQLSLFGGVAGILLARWGTAILTRVQIGDLSRIVDRGLGPAVLAFTIGASVVSGMVFAVVPALRVTRTDLVTPIKGGGRRAVRGRRGLIDRGLVALQVALALLLVSGAALLVGTLRNLQRADPGFDAAGRFAISVETRRTAYARQGMTVAMAEEMLGRVRAIPGVREAAFASIVPVYGGRGSFDNVSIRGAAPLADDDAQTWFTAITPGYFAALGIPIIAGRDIDAPRASVSSTAARDVVVNEQFAKKFFPDRSPIGQTFEDFDTGDTLRTQDRIVGVVRGSKFTSLRAAPTPMYFVPVTDHDWPFLVLVVHPANGTASIGADVSRVIAAVAPGIAQGDPTMLSATIDGALARERVSAGLATLFGLIALSLVAVGLYGVMLYQVTERTHEIGIRMALGARAESVASLVLRQSLGVVGVGLAAGIPLAWLAGRAVTSQLYGVAPFNLGALVLASGSLVAVAIAASLIPVRRALRVDPLTALRAE